jgi:hypothetical protein
MAETNFRGPIMGMGSLEIQSGTAATVEVMDGPSMFYQNTGWPDPRGIFRKDGTAPGRIPAFLSNSDIYSVDAIPSAANTSLLAAGQIITSGVAMALATVGVTNFSSGAASIAVGVPIIPQGTTVATTAIALDFGFTSGTTVANSTTVQVDNSQVFTLGQWIIIGNVGNSAATASLITQVMSIGTVNLTTIYVSPAPATAMGVPIGQANLWGSALLPPATQFGPSAPTASAHPFGGGVQSGMARVMNPREMLSRNVALYMASAAVLTATALVSGFDVWGQAMSELCFVNASSGVTTGWGKKAFKYITSVVPQTNVSTAGALALGWGDTFGFPFRADEPEQLEIAAGGTWVTNNVGVSTAVLTIGGSTNTTGDVRGTIQLSGNGAGTPISAVCTSNNVKRLVVIQNLGNYNMLACTPNFLTPMFGTTQA